MMKGRLLRSAIALLALGALAANEECPLGAQPQGGSVDGTALDIGGATGATWQVDADRTLQVTLQTGGQIASAKVEAGQGFVQLLGALIEVDDFCWRHDTVCPHQVLPTQAVLQQPTAEALLIAFNRRGPLARLDDRNALLGQLSGNDLTIPLAVGEASILAGNCGLLSGSGILGTAIVEPVAADADPTAVDPRLATRLQGRITVIYDGACLTLGGNAALPADSVVELSASFTATRR